MKVSTNINEIVYCGLRKCPHVECLRHNKNIPFDKLVHRDIFKPDKEWNCKNFLVYKGETR